MAVENLEIKCPKCNEIIDINEQFSHQLQEEFDDSKKQMEIQLRKELQQSHSGEIDKLKGHLKEKEGLLLSKKDEDEKRNFQIQEMQHKLDTQDQKIEVERNKAALEAKKEALQEYQKMAEELAKQKNAVSEQKNVELKIKINELEDQKRQTKEMYEEALRKAEQGSVQTQGEGGEIFIEEVLGKAFASDIISEVPKGTKGADVLQLVRFGSGIEAGIIVWEGKRTKGWANAWISKVKQDTVRANGHISVIVSDILPSGISRMRMIEENVWVCKYSELEGLATALRNGLIRAQSAIKSQEGKGDKMALLYDYMASQEFANEIRLVYDSYISDIDIIAKERRTMTNHWKAREKAAESRLLGVTGFMGTIKSIATELPVIKEIEAADQGALPAPKDEENN